MLDNPVQPRGLQPDDAGRLVEAASALKRAIDDLTQEIVTGRAIGRAEARDQFEIALSSFGQLIDRTAE